MSQVAAYISSKISKSVSNDNLVVTITWISILFIFLSLLALRPNYLDTDVMFHELWIYGLIYLVICLVGIFIWLKGKVKSFLDVVYLFFMIFLFCYGTGICFSSGVNYFFDSSEVKNVELLILEKRKLKNSFLIKFHHWDREGKVSQRYIQNMGLYSEIEVGKSRLSANIRSGFFKWAYLPEGEEIKFIHNK